MKMFKKLIPAIAMLVLSAAMVVTSSFAWFSSNSQVTATGMQVKAKADQLFMQIVAGDDNFDDTKAHTSADAKDTGVDKEYVPTAPCASFTTDELTAYNGGNGFKWVTGVSGNPDSHEIGEAGYEEVGNIGLHALVNTFKIRLNPNSGNNASGALVVSDVEVTGGESTERLRNSIAVLVVNEDTDKSMLWVQNAQNAWDVTGDADLSNGEIFTTDKDTNPYDTITVYIFFYGEHEDCKTNNIVPSAYNVTLTFDCSGDVTADQN